MNLKEIRKTYNSQVISEFISNLGDTLFFPVFISFAMQFEMSAVFLGLITISEYLPYVLAPFWGIFVDRNKKKIRLLYIAAVIQLVMYLILACLLNNNAVNVGLMIFMIILNFLTGCLNKVSNASSMALVLNIIDDEGEVKRFRSNAIGLKTVVTIAGQLLGAVLLTKFGATLLAGMNAISFCLPLLIILIFIKNYRYSEEMLNKKINSIEKRSFRSILKQIVNNKVLSKLMIFIGAINFTVIPLAALFIPQLLGEMEASLPINDLTICYGIVVVVFGVMTVIGVLVSQIIKLAENKIFKYLLGLGTVVCIIFGIMYLVKNFYGVLILAGIFGFVLGVFNVFSETFFYSHTPAEQVAVFNGVMQTVTMGTGVISTIIATPIIEKTGIYNTFLIYSGFLLILVIVAIATRMTHIEEGVNEICNR